MNVDYHQCSQSDSNTFIKFTTYKLHNLVDLIVTELKVFVQTIGFGNSFTDFTCPINTACSDDNLYTGIDGLNKKVIFKGRKGHNVYSSSIMLFASLTNISTIFVKATYQPQFPCLRLSQKEQLSKG